MTSNLEQETALAPELEVGDHGKPMGYWESVSTDCHSLTAPRVAALAAPSFWNSGALSPARLPR
jgi:hypothetical protein